MITATATASCPSLSSATAVCRQSTVAGAVVAGAAPAWSRRRRAALALVEWWREVVQGARVRRAHRRAQVPAAGQLKPLLGLSDAMLKDIGAPEGLRAAAAWRREQAAMLRQLDMLRASGPLRW